MRLGKVMGGQERLVVAVGGRRGLSLAVGM